VSDDFGFDDDFGDDDVAPAAAGRRSWRRGGIGSGARTDRPSGSSALGASGSTAPRVRRLPVFVALVALALAGAGLDRVARPADERADASTLAETMPVAAPTTALSSTWFCAGGTATPDAVDGIVADTAVTVANAGDEGRTGTITVVPVEGDPKTVPLQVGPRTRTRLVLHEVLAAPYAAALVELDGGDVAVDQDVSGPLGISSAPCASSASDHWYLAEGSTARDDSMRLVLYNPFPEDAIVDLAFATDQGRAVPSAFTGLVVKGGRLLVVKVEEHVRRRNNVAVTAVARSGRIVVDRLQLRGGAVKGVSLALAAPRAATTWTFGEGLVDEGIAERFHVYNPSSQEAEISLELSLDEGAAEPFDLTVPPRERLTIVTSEEERVPRKVGHAATVLSLNDVPIVAERSIAATAPAARTGISDALGIPRSAERWVLAAGSATEALDEYVVVVNPGPKDAVLSVRGLASGQFQAIEGLQDLALAAGRRTAIRLTDHIARADLSLLVTSSTPVVVERGVYAVGTPGIALSSGIPLR
jgi:hypothetical protein